jgi:hypothetical protein
MAFTTQSELRDVTGISGTEKAAIKTFMQGAIYCWVKNRKGEQFAVRDLMGGDNFEWKGTPLYVLYEKHIHQGKSSDAAIESAGKDLGWLVKTVLAEDKRTFDADKAGLVNAYCWVGNEQ